MQETPTLAYKFKICLLNTEPLVWRELHLPEQASLFELHVAIQDLMGWSDSHYFQFMLGHKIQKVCYGIPHPKLTPNAHPCWFVNLKEVCTPDLGEFLYEYNFQNAWICKIELQSIYTPNKELIEPKCSNGANASPPEDCGGTAGFKEFKVALADQSHLQHKDYLKWYGTPFDPQKFDHSEIEFSDPKQSFENWSSFVD